MSMLFFWLALAAFGQRATGKTKHHGPTEGCDNACQTECIGAINKYRSNHGAPPLTYSHVLAEKAQKWADRRIFGYDMRSRGKYGQLIEWDVKDDLPTFTSVIKHWHDNAKDFDFKTGKSKTGKTLHDFTQIVWKKAREVGCARNAMFGSRYYVVWMDADGVVSPKLGTEKENIGAPKEDDSTWFEPTEHVAASDFTSGSGYTDQEPATMRTLVADDDKSGGIGIVRKKSTAGESFNSIDVNEVENEQRILNNNVKEYLMDDEGRLDDVIDNEQRDTPNQSEFQEPGYQAHTADDGGRILNQAGMMPSAATFDSRGGGLASDVALVNKELTGGVGRGNLNQQSSPRPKGNDVVVNITVPKKPVQPPVTINITTGSPGNYTPNNNGSNNNNNNNNRYSDNGNNTNDESSNNNGSNYGNKTSNDNNNNDSENGSKYENDKNHDNSGNDNSNMDSNINEHNIDKGSHNRLIGNHDKDVNSGMAGSWEVDHSGGSDVSSQGRPTSTDAEVGDKAVNNDNDNNNNNNNSKNNNDNNNSQMKSVQQEQEQSTGDYGGSASSINPNSSDIKNDGGVGQNSAQSNIRLNGRPNVDLNADPHVLGTSNADTHVNSGSEYKLVTNDNGQGGHHQGNSVGGRPSQNPLGFSGSVDNQGNLGKIETRPSDGVGNEQRMAQGSGRKAYREEANAMSSEKADDKFPGVQFSKLRKLISLRLASLSKNRKENYAARPGYAPSQEPGNSATIVRKPGHKAYESTGRPGAQVDLGTRPSKPNLVIKLNDPKMRFMHMADGKLQMLAPPNDFSRLKSLSDKALPITDSSLVAKPVLGGMVPNFPNKDTNQVRPPGKHNGLVASHFDSATAHDRATADLNATQGHVSPPVEIKAADEAIVQIPRNNSAHAVYGKLPGTIKQSGLGFGLNGKQMKSNATAMTSELFGQDAHAPEISKKPANIAGAEKSPEPAGPGNFQEAAVDSQNSAAFQEQQATKPHVGRVHYHKANNKGTAASSLGPKLKSYAPEGFGLPKVEVFAEDPGKAQCRDDTAMCAVWVSHRGCKDTTYAAFMRQHCKETCGYCELPGEEKMNDEIVHQENLLKGACRDAANYAFSCPRWRRGGYCDKKPGEMRIFCRKTCGFCEDEDPAPSVPGKSGEGTNEVSEGAEKSPQASPETGDHTGEPADAAAMGASSPEYFPQEKLDAGITEGIANLQRKLKGEIHVSAVAKSSHPKTVAGNLKNHIPDVAEKPIKSKAKIHDQEAVTTDGCDMRCQNECLDAHNAYRANHGAPPLQLDPTLAQQAQSWADKKVFKHSPWASGAGGESIALGNLYPTFTAAVKAWHDEESDFDWTKMRSVNGRKVDHFTQVVWKRATLLGCGKTKVKGEPYYIAQMDIPGVIAETEPGYGRDNVQKPREPDGEWFMDSSPYWKDLQAKDSIVKNIDHYIL